MFPTASSAMLEMKLLILSDLHSDSYPFEISSSLDYDVAIFAGDILEPGRNVAKWIRNPMRVGPNKPAIQIAGNHEFYETIMGNELKLMRANAKQHDVHFLDCDEVVIDRVRFLGCTLWTDFKLRIDYQGFPGEPVRMLSDRGRGMAEALKYTEDYRSIRYQSPGGMVSEVVLRLIPMDTLSIHRRHRSWLRRKLAEPFNGRTVVITHHAPHRNSLAARFAEDWASTAFVNEMLPEFFERPVLWAHGHTHDSFDYSVGNCRVVCNPRGYMNWHGEPENRVFNPGLVIEV